MIIKNIKQIVDKYKINPKQELNLSKFSTNKEFFLNKNKKSGRQFLASIREEIKIHQTKLYASQNKSLLIIIQGMDTSGKDGTVKNIFNGIDPHGIEVHNFKKPTEKELSHDYLWRIHNLIPSKGKIGVFNRSQYEDVVAVRVRNTTPKTVWKNRFDHINNFEKLLFDENIHIIKFFLHISKSEQKERLVARLNNPNKLWKFNPADIKDRKYWDQYQIAYQEAIQKTSSSYAPWYVIPANSKWNRNLIIASIILEKFRNMDLAYPKPSFDPEDIKL